MFVFVYTGFMSVCTIDVEQQSLYLCVLPLYLGNVVLDTNSLPLSCSLSVRACVCTADTCMSHDDGVCSVSCMGGKGELAKRGKGAGGSAG